MGTSICCNSEKTNLFALEVRTTVNFAILSLLKSFLKNLLRTRKGLSDNNSQKTGPKNKKEVLSLFFRTNRWLFLWMWIMQYRERYLKFCARNQKVSMMKLLVILRTPKYSPGHAGCKPNNNFMKTSFLLTTKSDSFVFCRTKWMLEKLLQHVERSTDNNS